MTKLELIELIVIAAIIVVMSIYYLVKAIKNHWLSKISDTIIQAMRTAEASGKTGPEKKDYVLEQIQQLCVELGIPYAFIKKLIDRFIEKTIKSYNNMTKE